jgi:hypothetical protein
MRFPLHAGGSPQRVEPTRGARDCIGEGDFAMETRHRRQQRRGAQNRSREHGEPPAEAVKDRSAQAHDRADQDASPENAPKPPVYPAGRLEDETGDNTPSAPDPRVEWDDVVQPPRGVRVRKDQPLPEGK